MDAILAPRKRTVTSALRVMGLSTERHFQNYRRVLNRAVWSCRLASRLLFGLLLTTFAPSGPILLGLDDTIERRWGPRFVPAASIALRSARRMLISSRLSGLRSLSLMLLVPTPWAGRVWALPFLTALAPSRGYWQQHKRKPKLLTDWARQLVLQVQRSAPNRRLVLVADGGFAALELLARLTRRLRSVICITRLRLEARLFALAPLRQRGTKGRPRLVGRRLPSLQRILTHPRTTWQRLKLGNWIVTALGWSRSPPAPPSGTTVGYFPCPSVG